MSRLNQYLYRMDTGCSPDIRDGYTRVRLLDVPNCLLAGGDDFYLKGKGQLALSFADDGEDRASIGSRFADHHVANYPVA